MVAHQQSPATISRGFAFMADPLRLRRPRASTGIGCQSTDSSNSHIGLRLNGRALSPVQLLRSLK